MSTKNLDNRVFVRLAVFVIVSFFIHASAGLFMLSAGPVSRFFFRAVLRERPPLAVEVVELEPGPKGKEPFKSRRFADRSQTVKRETFPERHKAPDAKGAAPETPPATHPPLTSGAVREKTGDIAPPEDKEKVLKGTGEAVSPGEGVGPGPDAGVPAPSRPKLLLPQEKIAELERRYEGEEPKGESGKTLQLNTTELRYQKYLVGMKNRIQLYWDYPDVAARNGWQGRLQINFTIRKDGTVGDILLVKSSGYPALDDAAITALKLAAPFPPFPENFGIEQINIKGQFEYSIVYYQPTQR